MNSSLCALKKNKIIKSQKPKQEENNCCNGEEGAGGINKFDFTTTTATTTTTTYDKSSLLRWGTPHLKIKNPKAVLAISSAYQKFFEL